MFLVCPHSECHWIWESRACRIWAYPGFGGKIKDYKTWASLIWAYQNHIGLILKLSAWLAFVDYLVFCLSVVKQRWACFLAKSLWQGRWGQSPHFLSIYDLSVNRVFAFIWKCSKDESNTWLLGQALKNELYNKSNLKCAAVCLRFLYCNVHNQTWRRLLWVHYP